jgi:glucose/arabinose dehydrogenase
MPRNYAAIAALLVTAGALMAGCSAPTTTPSPSSTVQFTQELQLPANGIGTTPTGELIPVVSNLDVPWSIVTLADGSILLSHRDTAEFTEVIGDTVRVIGSFPDADPARESGLLGIAVFAEGGQEYLYAYATTATDNRVVRMLINGDAGDRSLGAPEVVISGIPRETYHVGGRIKFGPDGMLYITAGDAGDFTASQDPASLAGKILRITPTGQIPADNPYPGSAIWSLGHRNPQGIAWAEDGTMWAAEFGQNTWDEVNIIVPGGNYGWPTHEGNSGADGFIDPIQQWATDDASPSGIAIVGDTVFMAALGGQRLWAVGFNGDAEAWFDNGELGRVRDVVEGPGNTLYVITNNTDGRGQPREGDDILYQVPLQP